MVFTILCIFIWILHVLDTLLFKFNGDFLHIFFLDMIILPYGIRIYLFRKCTRFFRKVVCRVKFFVKLCNTIQWYNIINFIIPSCVLSYLCTFLVLHFGCFSGYTQTYLSICVVYTSPNVKFSHSLPKKKSCFITNLLIYWLSFRWCNVYKKGLNNPKKMKGIPQKTLSPQKKLKVKTKYISLRS